MAASGDGISIAERFREFAVALADEAPLYSHLCEAIVGDDELLALAGGVLPGQPPPNMLFAAVQFLLSNGPPHRLADWYPAMSGGPPSGGDPFPVFREFCLTHRVELAELIASRRTQTNEVARCLALLPAFATVAGRAGRPLSLIEVGSSAGLLLAFDRYHYEYGSARWGPPDAPLRLSTELRGPVPPLPAADMRIASRVGIDLHPVDVTDPVEVRWLDALVWPGHEERRARLRRAIDAVASDPPPVLAADALAVIEELIAAVDDRAMPVVFHSFALFQWTSAQRADLESLLRGARRPVTRVSLEWFGYQRNLPFIKLIQYQGGSEQVETLGRAHHHGRWLEWGPDEAISGS